MKILDLIKKFPSIYNPESKAVFIEDCYGHLKQKEIVANIRLLDQISKTEHFIGKDLNTFTLQDYAFLFERCGWISLGTFYVRKSFVESYLDWSVKLSKTEFKHLEAIRLLNNTDLTGTLFYTTSHFKDLNELIAANKAIIDNEVKLQSIPEKSSLIMQETLTYLIWLRLSMDEISELKYTDIKDQKIILRDRIIDIPDCIYGTIQECIKVDEFLYFLRNRVIPRKYASSLYVVRSTQIEQVTTNALHQWLTNYSKLSEKLPLSNEFYNKDFRYNSINRSSLFSSFYQYETDNKTNIKNFALRYKKNMLSVAFPNEDISVSIIQDYLRWRSFYYGV